MELVQRLHFHTLWNVHGSMTPNIVMPKKGAADWGLGGKHARKPQKCTVECGKPQLLAWQPEWFVDVQISVHYLIKAGRGERFVMYSKTSVSDHLHRYREPIVTIF